MGIESEDGVLENPEDEGEEPKEGDPSRLEVYPPEQYVTSFAPDLLR